MVASATACFSAILIFFPVSTSMGKSSVKFKDLETSGQSAYRGPLISVTDLLGDRQPLIDISFSKYLSVSGSRAVEGAGNHDKAYIECADDHLEEGMRKSLSLINKSQKKKVDLVFYRESLLQAVRISRILVRFFNYLL